MRIVILAFVLILPYSRSVDNSATLYKLQAVYLFNFAKYIKWQQEVSVFTIGVYDESQSPIIEELESHVKGQRVNNKIIKVKVFTSLTDGLDCQIVYLPKSKSKELSKMMETFAGKSILIVTEDDLSRKGAPISFVVIDEKLRFKLNQKSLGTFNLEAATGLLRLAILV